MAFLEADIIMRSRGYVMRKLAFIDLTEPPRGFLGYAEHAAMLGYDDSFQFYGAYEHGQMVGYGAVKDRTIVHVASIDPTVRDVLTSNIEHLLGALQDTQEERTSAAKPKEPKDQIAAPIPFIYDAIKHHIQIGYAGEKTRDIQPYRGEFSKGGIVEGEYAPGGKMTIRPTNGAICTTRSIVNAWKSQFPQMEITSLESERNGKKDKISRDEGEYEWATSNVKDSWKDAASDWASISRSSTIGYGSPVPTISSHRQTQTFTSNPYKIATRQSMAADPEWLNSWIAQNGPYAYHSFPQDMRDQISRTGLLPWDHPGNPTQSSYINTLYETRPNHVYMGLPITRSDGTRYLMNRSPYVAKVDLSRLDPTNLTADEDSLSSLHMPYGLKGLDPSHPSNGGASALRGTQWDSLGDYAEGHAALVDHPLSTQRSIQHNYSVAHKGSIPPDKFEIVRYDDEFPSNQRTAAVMPPGKLLRVIAMADPAAALASEALEFAGGTVYVVGGAVRDVLMGGSPRDIDLMVTGLPSHEVNDILSKLPGRMDLTGKRFGVYRYRHDGSEVEIALPRHDRYESGRRGEGQIEVDHNMPVADDLLRRDFTINSMALDLNTGQIVDPYGGREDIDRRTLRTTHPDSFKEDPTRLIRALTAHSRFGLNPDERTREEMRENAHLLRGESPDALNKHLDKLLSSGHPASAMRLAHETGVLHHLFPEVDDNWDFDQHNAHHSFRLGDHLMNVLDNVSRESSDPDLRMAALLHDIGKPTSYWEDPATGTYHYYQTVNNGIPMGADHEEVGARMAHDRLRAFNYPTARIDRVTHLIGNHMFPAFNTQKGARRFLQRVGDEHADDLMRLREADAGGKGQTQGYMDSHANVEGMRSLIDEVRKGQQPTDLKNLAVNGNDLISVGIPQGPEIGAILRSLLDDVVSDPQLNSHDQLIQRAIQYAQGYSNNGMQAPS